MQYYTPKCFDESSALCFTVDFPPSINCYYNVKNSCKYVTKAGKDYKKSVIQQLNAYLTHGINYFQHPNRLGIFLLMNRADKRRIDLDNYCKALLDAITESNLIEDDSQIDLLITERHIKFKAEKNTIDVTLFRYSE